MPRIVSLIASATEIVRALGLEDQLVGCSHECDFPDSVRRLPVCTEPKFDVEGSSRAIDERVKAVVQDGLSVYRVHTDVLEKLRPDLIITQSQCEVCAVSLADVEAAIAQCLDFRSQIVSLSPNSLADVWEDILRVAGSAGVAGQGEALVGRLRQRMEAIAERSRSSGPRTVACIEWIDPLMACGNWMPELVEMAGGVNLFGVAGEHSPWMTWEQLREKDPEVILVTPCGFDIERTRQDMAALAGRPGWHDLQAVRNRHVYLADGNQFFNRPGPRLVESLEILAELLHPSQFQFGHEGTGWESL